MKTITIYTDGSCQTQTRIGGWAVVLRCGDHRKVLTGNAADTTVNEMELTAVVNGLKALKLNSWKLRSKSRLVDSSPTLILPKSSNDFMFSLIKEELTS